MKIRKIKINEADVRKNIHQTHLEDLVLFGESGLNELNNKIEGMFKRINGEESDIHTTVKIDGAPAVICWSHIEDYPDNSICLKSFVNGAQNALSSNEEIESKYGDRPEMAAKLKYCLQLAPCIPSGEAWQGDCLFTARDKKEVEIDDKQYLTFHPNKIVYAFSEDNPGYDNIVNANFGIAFHTIYKKSGDSLKQSFRVDASRLNNVPEDIYVMSPALNASSKGDDYNAKELNQQYNELKKLEQELISMPEYEELINNDTFMKYWNTFENANLADKKQTNIDVNTFYEDLVKYIKDKQTKEFEKRMSTLKTDKGRQNAQANYDQSVQELADLLSKNHKVLVILVKTLNKAADIKMNLWNGFKKSKQDYSTYYQSKTKGYIPADMEGVAMSDADGNIVKIVDRSQFSNANRDPDIMSGFEHESLEENKDPEWVKNTINTVSNTMKDSAVRATIEYHKKKLKAPGKGAVVTGGCVGESLEEAFNTLLEDAGKTAVVAFGRVNPPTIGHKKLVDKINEVASKTRGIPMLFLSHSHDVKKNPLPYESKLQWAQKAFGDIVKESDALNIYKVLAMLYKQGYDEVYVVTGSDRENEYQAILNYNGKEVKNMDDFYKFDNIHIINAGDRSDDAEGAEGASASKAREFAKNGDFDSFSKIVPFERNDAHKLYSELKKEMNIDEQIKEVLGRMNIFEALNELQALVEDERQGNREFTRERNLNTANSLKDAYGLLRSELVKAGAKNDALSQFDKSVTDIETITNTLGVKDIKLLGKLGDRLNKAAAGLSATEFVKMFSPTKKDIEIIINGIDLKENNDVDSYKLSENLVNDMIKCTQSDKSNTANIGPYEFLIAVLYKGGSYKLAGGGTAGDVSALYEGSQSNIEVKGVDDRAVIGYDIGASAEITSAFDDLMSKSVDSKDRIQKTRQPLWPESFPNYKFNKKDIPNVLQNIPGVGKSGEISYHDLYMLTFRHLIDMYSKRFDLLALCRSHKIKIIHSENLVDYLVANGNVNFSDHFGTRKFKIQPKKSYWG